MDSNQRMDTGAEKADQNKRQCYRCKDCYLSFTDNQTLKEHLKKNCLNTSAMSESEAFYESGLNNLHLAMRNEKDSLDALSIARAKAKNAVMRYSEALEREQNAERLHTNAVLRKKAFHTAISSTEHSILSDIVKETSRELETALNEVQLWRGEVNEALHPLKEFNHAAKSAASKVHSAYTEVAQACREKLTSAALAQKSNQVLQNIKALLQSRYSVLIELHNGVEELENAASKMLGVCSKKEEPRIMENVCGINPTQNELKRKLAVDDDEMDVSMDDARPSTSGAHENEPVIVAEERKKVPCARRLSFS